MSFNPTIPWQEFDVLSALSDAERALLAPHLTPRFFPAQQVICSEGEDRHELYFLSSGRFQIWRHEPDGPDRVLGEAGPGDLFGEVAWVTGEPRSANARALRDTVAWELGEEAYRTLAAEHSALVRHITRLVVERLRPRARRLERGRALVLALVPLVNSDLAGSVAERLQQVGAASGHRIEIVPAPAGSTETARADDFEWSQRLADIERRSDCVLLPAEPADAAWMRRCLQNADRVWLIANSSSAPETLQIQNTCREIPARTRTDLILVRNAEGTTKHLPEWAAAFHEQRSHDVRLTADEDWSRLLERQLSLSGPPSWLVQSGLFDSVSKVELRALQSELEWRELSGQEVLFEQGGVADGLYIIVDGRLQVLIRGSDDAERVIGEMGRGEVIGEMSLLTGAPRSATVRALRDSTVVRLSPHAFQRQAQTRPEFQTQLTRVIVDRMSGQRRTATAARTLSLTLVPISPGVSLNRIGEQLRHVFAEFGTVCALDAAAVRQRFGEGALHTRRGEPGDALLVEWLNLEEANHDCILTLADHDVTPWTERCLRQADRVLLIADAAASPDPTRFEQQVTQLAREWKRPTSLLLLHPPGIKHASNTAIWLTPRTADRHFHVRKENHADLQRVARLLTGRARGLALSGGGSRGAAHVGVIRALADASFPVDVVYGASAGAAIAGLVALQDTPDEMLSKVTRMLTQPWGHVLTMGPPLVSMMSGRHPTRLLHDWFGSLRLEDQFVPCGIVSVDLVQAAHYVHQHGSIRDAVRASSSLPAAWPPVIEGGRMLVDGGVLNNLPVDLLEPLCPAGAIVAADIAGAEDYSQYRSYGLELSGWSILWRKLLPFGPRAVLPSLLSTLSRCVTLGSSQRAARLRTDNRLLLLQLPVTQYGLFDIRTPEVVREVEQLAYDYTRQALANWPQREGNRHEQRTAR